MISKHNLVMIGLILILIIFPLWGFISFDHQLTVNFGNNGILTNLNPTVIKSSPNFITSVRSCTIFTVENGDSVFFGNNEDESGSRKNTEIWFDLARDENTYGCAYLGFANNAPGDNDIDGIAIGGINTQGLCFDANGVPPPVNVKQNTDGVRRSGIHNWEFILEECASVEEVIQWHQTHNMEGWWGDQIHWADASGDAVVISACFDQELAFTRKNSSHLISTNFNLADFSHGYWTCSRYTTVTTMLEDIIQEESLSIKAVRDILKAVRLRQTSSYIGTVYSNIFDLKTRDIYLYIHGDYENVVTLNLETELAQGDHSYKMSELTTDRSELTTIVELVLFPLSICVFIAYTVWFVRKRRNKVIN